MIPSGRHAEGKPTDHARVQNAPPGLWNQREDQDEADNHQAQGPGQNQAPRGGRPETHGVERREHPIQKGATAEASGALHQARRVPQVKAAPSLAVEHEQHIADEQRPLPGLKPDGQRVQCVFAKPDDGPQHQGTETAQCPPEQGNGVLARRHGRASLAVPQPRINDRRDIPRRFRPRARHRPSSGRPCVPVSGGLR